VRCRAMIAPYVSRDVLHLEPDKRTDPERGAGSSIERFGTEACEQMSAPAFRTTLGALARYLPGLSGIRFL
jgi:hypothetical protein